MFVVINIYILIYKGSYYWSYVHSFIHSFIHQWLYSPLLGPGLLFSFGNNFFTQTVGLLGRVISPSQGRCLHTREHKHIINAHTDIHALSGIRTHDPSVQASEDSSCLRPRGHWDRRWSCVETGIPLETLVNVHRTTLRLSQKTGTAMGASDVAFHYCGDGKVWAAVLPDRRKGTNMQPVKKIRRERERERERDRDRKKECGHLFRAFEIWRIITSWISLDCWSSA
jgi:hypothetical protein